MPAAEYIHGTAEEEQERLALLNELTNGPFLEYLGITPGMRVLDVGAGLCILAREVAARAGAQGRVVAIEQSPEQLASARRRAAATAGREGGVEPELVLGDAQSLPFDAASFDVAYCRYLLEHVADPRAVLREMRRVVRPGGVVVAQENDLHINVTYPECPAFSRAWRAFCELQVDLGGDPAAGRRLHAWLLDVGFTRIEVGIAPEVHAHAANPSRFDGWVRNVIGNLKSAEARLVDGERRYLSRAELGAAIDELEGLRGRRDAAWFFYWNRVRGTV